MRGSLLSGSVLGFAFLVVAAPAVRGADLASDFLGCVGIGNAAGRLACYDHVAASVRSLPDAEKPDFAPGKILRPRPTAASAIPSVTVDLVSMTSTSDGKSIFNLSNGQVWESEDDDPVYPEASGNKVTISRSGLGIGYHLRMNKETKEITVRRIE